MEDCLFCKIWSKQIPAETLFRDDELMVIKDIHPKAPVHLLIIPKEHLESVATLSEAQSPIIGKMVYRAKLLAEDLSIASTGYRLILNTRSHSGQEVDHIHLHLLGGEPLGRMVG